MKRIINKVLVWYRYRNAELVIWDVDETLYFSRKTIRLSRFVFFLLFIRDEIKSISEYAGFADSFREKEKLKKWYEIAAEKLGEPYRKVVCLSERILKKENHIKENLKLISFFDRSKKKHLILSDSSSESVKKILFKLGFSSFDNFLDIIGIDNSLEPKPSTKVLKKILKKYLASPRKCLVIGDSIENDINPAKKVGMKTILISNLDNKHDFYSVNSINELMEYVGE